MELVATNPTGQALDEIYREHEDLSAAIEREHACDPFLCRIAAWDLMLTDAISELSVL